MVHATKHLHGGILERVFSTGPRKAEHTDRRMGAPTRYGVWNDEEATEEQEEGRMHSILF